VPRSDNFLQSTALLSSRLRESLAAVGLLSHFDIRSTDPSTEILATLAERLTAALDRLNVIVIIVMIRGASDNLDQREESMGDVLSIQKK